MDQDNTVSEEEPIADAEPLPEDEAKTIKDEVLVHLVFSTDLIETIINGVKVKRTVKFEQSGNGIEMGYVAHLSRLAIMLQDVLETKQEAKIGVEEDHPRWVEFC